MKKMGDGCEEVKMAQFWDCNPYVSVNQGHMMLKENYARSALDGIVKIACKTSNASFEKMVYAYTETSIGCLKLYQLLG
jgi:hypothetical protein